MSSEWNRVLLNWINSILGLKLKETAELSDENIFHNVIRHLNKTNETIDEFLLREYPDFKKPTHNVSLGNPTYEVLLASLLLHYACIKVKDGNIRAAMCLNLNASDQKAITQFVEMLMKYDIVTEHNLINALQASSTDVSFKESSLAISTPMKLNSVNDVSPMSMMLSNFPISTPITQKSRRIFNLEAELAAERFDRNFLQEDLNRKQRRISELENLQKSHISEIHRLRENLTATEDRNKPKNNEICNQCTNKEKFLQEQRRSFDLEILRLESEAVTVEGERDSLKDKVSNLENDLKKWQVHAVELESTIDLLNTQSEQNQCEIASLKTALADTTKCLNEYRNKNLLNTSVECDDDTFSKKIFNISLNATPENLGKAVVDIQLREQLENNHILIEQSILLKEENGILKKQVEKYLEEIYTLGKEISEKSTEALKIAAEVCSLKEDVAKHELLLDFQKEEICVLKSEKELLNDAVKNRDIELNALHSKIIEIENDKSLLTVNIENLKFQLEHLQCEHNESEKQLILLKDENQNIIQKNKVNEKIIEKQNDELEQLQQKIHFMINENNKMTEEGEKNKSLIMKLECEIDNHKENLKIIDLQKSEITKLEEKIESITDKCQKLQQHNLEYCEKIDLIEMKADKITSENIGLTSKLLILENDKKACQLILESQKNEIFASETKIQLLEKEIEENKITIEKLNTKIRGIEKQNLSFITDSDNLYRQLMKLIEEVDQRDIEIMNIESEKQSFLKQIEINNDDIQKQKYIIDQLGQNIDFIVNDNNILTREDEKNKCMIMKLECVIYNHKKNLKLIDIQKSEITGLEKKIESISEKCQKLQQQTVQYSERNDLLEIKLSETIEQNVDLTSKLLTLENEKKDYQLLLESHETEIFDLKTKTQSFGNEIEEYKLKIEELNTKIKEIDDHKLYLITDNENLQRQVTQINKEIYQRDSQLMNIKNEKHVLLQQIEIKNEDIEKQKDAIDQLQQKINSIISENNNLTKKYEKTKSLIVKLENQIDNHKEDLKIIDLQKSEITKLEEKIESITDECQKLQQHNLEYCEKIDLIEMKAKETTAKNTELTSKLLALENEKKDCQLILESQKNDICALETKTLSLKTEIEENKVKIEELNSKIIEIEDHKLSIITDNQNLQCQLSNLNKEINQRDAQMMNIENEKQMLLQQIEMNNEDIQKQKDKIDQLAQKIDFIINDNNILTQEDKKNKSMIMKLECEIDNHKENLKLIDLQKAEITGLEEKIESISDECQKLQQRNVQHSEKNDLLEMKLTEKIAHNVDMTSRLQLLENEIEENEAKIEELNTKIMEIENHKFSFITDNENLQHQVNHLNEEINQRDSQIMNIENEKQMLLQHIELNNEDIQKHKHTIDQLEQKNNFIINDNNMLIEENEKNKCLIMKLECDVSKHNENLKLIARQISEITELEDKINLISFECQKLQQQNVQYSEKNDLLEMKLSETIAQNVDMTSKLQFLENEVDDNEAKIQELNVKMMEIENHKLSFISDNENLQHQVNHLNEKINQCDTQIKNYESEKQMLLKQVEMKNENIQKQKVTIDQFDDKINLLTDQNFSLIEQERISKDIILKLECEIDSHKDNLKAHLQSSRTQLDLLNDKIQELQRQNEMSCEKSNLLEPKLNEKSEQAIDLANKLLALENDTAKCESELKFYKEKVYLLESEIQSSINEIGEKESEITVFNLKINEIKEQNKLLIADKESLECQINNLNIQYHELNIQFNSFKIENQNLRKLIEVNEQTVENYVSTITQLEDKIEKIFSENQVLIEKDEKNMENLKLIAHQQSLMVELEKEFKQSKAECQDLQKENESYHERNKLLEKTNKEYELTLKCGEEQVIAMNTEMESLKNEINAKQAQLDALCSLNVDIEKEKSFLDKDKQCLQSQIIVLNEEKNQIESKFSLVKNENEAMSHQIKLNEETIEKNKNIIRLLEDKIHLISDQNQLLLKQGETNQNKIDQLQIEINKQKENSKLIDCQKSKIDELENTILSTKNENIYLKEEVEKYQKRVSDNLMEIDVLKEKLEDANERIYTENVKPLVEHDKIVQENLKLSVDLQQKESEISQLKKYYSEYILLKTAYDSLLISHQKIKDQLKSMEPQDTNQLINEIRNEYEDKLTRMKQKMKQLYQEQIAIYSSKQKEEIIENKEKQKEEIAALEALCKKYGEKIKSYEAHVNQLSSELWKVGEKLLMERNEKDWLKQQLKKHNGSTQSLNSVSSLSQIRMGANKNQTIQSRNSNMPCDITPISADVKKHQFKMPDPVDGESGGLHMSDEEGEMFDNRYLNDLKSGASFREMNSTMRNSIQPGRLSELQWRNSLCLPHLKSSYPAETQFQSFKEEVIKASGENLDDTLTLKINRPKKEVGQTSYKKPGPPTPSKKGGRQSLQGMESREPLKEQNDNARKNVTPSRIKALFMGNNSKSSSRDENAFGTPKGRRLSIFRKQR